MIESQIVKEAFARHGFGFQFAVVRECERLRQSRKSTWWPDATEFPVEVNGTHLHIDLVLRNPAACMAIECKRVNPAYGVWAFARSAFSERDSSRSSQVALEQVGFDRSANQVFVRWQESEQSDAQFHVGMDVRLKGQAGDPTGGGRGTWNEAHTQALRGASGLIHTVAAEPALLGNQEFMSIVPVVVTTARLLTVTGDLADTDLKSGELSDSASVGERQWLWVRAFASSNVRQTRAQRRGLTELPAGRYSNQFGFLAARDYARSVAVVTVNGLEEFLQTVSTFHVGGDFV
jgi:hypothetical protein